MPYKLYQDGKKDLSLRMLNSLYQEILINKEYQFDSFWINTAANYLVGLTLLLSANGKEKENNLGSIYVLMMEYERKGFDKLKLYLENYNLIIDNADNLNKIIRLNVIIGKFTDIIDITDKEYELLKVGNYNVLSNLVAKENNYINPNEIELNWYLIKKRLE